MIVSGSMRKRENANGKSWQITVELPRDPITGKRNRVYRTVNGTKKEAEHEMRKLITEIEKGVYIPDNNITISEWMKTWLDVYIIPNVSPTTLSGYEGMIRRYINPLIGHIPVQSLTTIAVQAWVNSLKVSPSSGKEMSAKTIKHCYHVLKGSMDKAVLAEIINRSPCTGVMLPKGKKKPAVVYCESDIRKLIQAAKGTEMELIIDLELCMGMRRGELLGLQWCDVDWEKNQIHICRNRVVVKGKSLLKDPKTAAGNRILDVPEILMKKLYRHRMQCMENQLQQGSSYTATDFIIVHPDGKPIYPEYVSQLLTKLQERAGLPKCRFHDLRHLCASIMLKQGVNVKVAQERLGHADISTTLNIYSHVLPSSAKEAAEKIGAMVYDGVAI